MDILERADVPLYSSDDNEADANGLLNLPVLAKALLPPPISEAVALPAASSAAPDTAGPAAGCDARKSCKLPSGTIWSASRWHLRRLQGHVGQHLLRGHHRLLVGCPEF